MKFFWSWQSDTPGETGRYFVRNALLAAVKQLRQPEDVEEPTSASHREAMEVTSDRHGVTGSPPLAATIEKKIDECEVFIADITPVSRVPRRKGVKMARCHHRWEKSAKLWGFCRIVSPGVVYERRSSVQVRGDQAATPGSLIMGSSLTGVRLSRLM